MREIEELLKFIKNSPSMFHTIETISKELKAARFSISAGDKRMGTESGRSLLHDQKRFQPDRI